MISLPSYPYAILIIIVTTIQRTVVSMFYQVFLLHIIVILLIRYEKPIDLDYVHYITLLRKFNKKKLLKALHVHCHEETKAFSCILLSS